MVDFIIVQSIVEVFLIIILILLGVFVGSVIRKNAIWISVGMINLQKRKCFHFAGGWHDKVEDNCCFLGPTSNHIKLIVIIMGMITYLASITIITFPSRLQEFFPHANIDNLLTLEPMFYVRIIAPILFITLFPITLIFLTGVRTVIKKTKIINPAARPYLILISVIGIPWAIIWGILQSDFFTDISSTIFSFLLLYGAIVQLLDNSEELVFCLKKKLISNGMKIKDFNFLF